MLKGKGPILVLAFIAFCGLLLWSIGIGRILFGSSLYGFAMGAGLGIILAIVGIQGHERILIKATRGKPINPAQYENLYDGLKKLSLRYKIDTPKMYCTDDMIPAFAVFGSSVDRMTIVFTREFLDKSRPEIVNATLAWAVTLERRGLLQNKTLASTLAYIFMFPAKLGDVFSLGTGSRHNIVNFILLLPLAPLASILVHLGAGAKRDIYEVDNETSQLTGDPGFLGVALIELDKKQTNFMVDIDLALLPLFISPPICTNRYYRMFRPHPPIGKRINRLMKRRKKERQI